MTKTTNPKISIIIPVYNSEKFLNKCLDSIVNQTFKDFEVIIIDDGSTDSSIKIIEKFCSENNNFYFQRQSHSGQGTARNLGIQKARGDFLSFIDSDDFIHKNFLQTLYLTAKNNNADIVCCGTKLYYPQYNLCLPFPSKKLKPGVYESKAAFRKIIEDIEINSFPWDKIFKRSLFIDHKCKFKNMYFEDMVLIPQLFFYANRIAVIPNAMYNYSQHRESTLGSMNKKKINDFIDSLKYVKTFLEENHCYEEFKSEFNVRATKSKLINTVTEFRSHFVNGSFKNFINDVKYINKRVNEVYSDVKS